MSKRQIKRLMRQAQDATGLSRRELLEVLEDEGLPAETERASPPADSKPVNPLIRSASKPTS